MTSGRRYFRRLGFVRCPLSRTKRHRVNTLAAAVIGRWRIGRRVRRLPARSRVLASAYDWERGLLALTSMSTMKRFMPTS